MSKESGKSLKQHRLDRAQPAAPASLVTVWVRKVLSWPRLVRIALISLFALASTAAVFPVIDSIYLANFYAEETSILPSFLAVAVGIIMYGVGWWLVVGIRGEDRPERAAVLAYCAVGLILTLFVLILILNGYYVATLPDI